MVLEVLFFIHSLEIEPATTRPEFDWELVGEALLAVAERPYTADEIAARDCVENACLGPLTLSAPDIARHLLLTKDPGIVPKLDLETRLRWLEDAGKTTSASEVLQRTRRAVLLVFAFAWPELTSAEMEALTRIASEPTFAVDYLAGQLVALIAFAQGGDRLRERAHEALRAGLTSEHAALVTGQWLVASLERGELARAVREALGLVDELDRAPSLVTDALSVLYEASPDAVESALSGLPDLGALLEAARDAESGREE